MPSATPPLPTDIDGVIERLKGIIVECAAAGDRLGYFAALYNRVTETVKEGIARGEFQDGPRMERLDVIFACRYLAAYDAYRAGELPSQSWLKAFAAAENPQHIVLQHLLAGMNAHINLDLGVAAARVAPGAELAGLQADFDRINGVLASLTPTVENEVDALSPDLRVISHLDPRLTLKFVGFSMDGARTEAWKLAQALAPLPPQAQLPLMAKRDAEAALIADAVLADGLIVHAIRAKESQDVARNIAALAAGEFTVAVPASTAAPAAG